MYKLSRRLLMISVIAFAFAAAVLTLFAGPLGWMVLITGAVVMAKRRRIAADLTSHGTARWADTSDLRNARMLDADRGVILGHLASQESISLYSAVNGLFQRNIADKQACEDFHAAFRKKMRPKPLVRLSRAIHTAVFSPSGGGKGVSIVIPFLRSCSTSCVVIDPKGENAQLTANYRREAFGQQFALLDPFKVVTQTPSCLNVLDAIDKDDPHSLDHCRDLAKALVIRTPDEKEPHWNDAAEMWITAIIAVVVFYGDRKEGTRSLQTVRDILSNPQKLELSSKLLRESNLCGGLLARMGGQLAHFIDKEKSSVLTTVSRHLRFLDTPAVVESTKTSTFDPALLRSGKLTVYLILPPNHTQAQSPLLRVWITAMLRAVVAGGLQEHNLTYLVLDEAASLGHLDAIDNAVDQYRGYGLRILFLFQSLGQLHKCFPQGQGQTLLSNVTQVFFGVNDQATADYVSARLGDETIIVKSGGTSTGRSTSWSNGSPGQSSHGGGTSTNESDNWQPQARRLLQPPEVVNLSPRVAITFTPGVRPICTWLTRYYEQDPRKRTASPIQESQAAWNMMIFAACLCAVTVALAALLL